MTTARDRLKWLKTLFPIRGLGWLVVGPLISVIVLAVAAAVWFLLRHPAEDALGALSDVLTTDAKVWHLLVALGLEGLAMVTIAVAMWRMRSQPARRKVTIWSFRPDEIAHFGVLWPITTESNGSRVTGFSAGRPMCPKCHTPLSLKIKDDMIPLDGAFWATIGSDNALFQCPKDGLQYDLREHKWDMGGLTSFVNDLAMGEYRAAQAAARTS